MMYGSVRAWHSSAEKTLQWLMADTWHSLVHRFIHTGQGVAEGHPLSNICKRTANNLDNNRPSIERNQAFSVILTLCQRRTHYQWEHWSSVSPGRQGWKCTAAWVARGCMIVWVAKGCTVAWVARGCMVAWVG